MFHEPFNDIRKSLIQWVLTLASTLWRFRIPSGLQFPKWELIWGCGGSFPHTLTHFTFSHTPESMKCDSRPSHLAHTFASLVMSPRLGLWHLQIFHLFNMLLHFLIPCFPKPCICPKSYMIRCRVKIFRLITY
jgi:hypothetical protein